MKRNIFITWLFGILAMGCGKFGNVNVSPNDPSEKDTRYMLLRAEQGITGSVFSTTTLAPTTDPYNPVGQLYPQYFGEAKSLQYTALNIINGSATDYYSIFMRTLRDIQNLNVAEESKTSSFVVNLGPNNDQIGLAMTLEAYYMMTIVDTFGSMPYTEILQGESGNFTPVFNTVEEIYTGLDAQLKEAYNLMSNQVSIDGTFDILYKGDMSKWKKLNATLRMALAIKLSDIAPEVGKTRFAAAFADGGIATNADNLVYPYLDENNNANPLYVNYVVSGRKDFYPTSTLTDAFLKLKDGRVLAYAQPNTANKNNVITGAPWGITKSKLTGFLAENPVSELAEPLIKRNYPLVIFSAAKVKLMEAEAAVRGWISADPTALYNEAIRLSFEEKDVAGRVAALQGTSEGSGTLFDLVQSQNNLLVTADEYLAQPEVQLNGSTEEKIEKIAYQRWLNGFMQNGIEAWSDWRRLNVPKLEVGEFASESGITQIPYRLVLSSDDWDQNRENYEKMVAAQGPNTTDTRIWWDVANN